MEKRMKSRRRDDEGLLGVLVRKSWLPVMGVVAAGAVFYGLVCAWHLCAIHAVVALAMYHVRSVVCD